MNNWWLNMLAKLGLGGMEESRLVSKRNQLTSEYMNGNFIKRPLIALKLAKINSKINYLQSVMQSYGYSSPGGGRTTIATKWATAA